MQPRDTPDEETSNWRAVCGRTARTVRRAGRVTFPTPIGVRGNWVVPAGGEYWYRVKLLGIPQATASASISTMKRGSARPEMNSSVEAGAWSAKNALRAER